MGLFGKSIITVTVVALLLLVFSCGGDKKKTDNKNQVQQKDTSSYVYHEKILNERITADVNNAALYNQRALLHLRFGDFQRALNDVTRALHIDSTTLEYTYTKGEIYFGALRLDKAMLEFEKVLSKDKNHWRAHLKMAKIFKYLERFQDAIDHINEALKQDEHLAEAYFLKGSVYELLGDSAKAATSFQTAVEQKADYYDAYISLGLLYGAARNKMALEYYNTALALKPGSLEALYNKAIFQQDNGMLPEAIATYRQILAVKNDFEIAYHNIGYIYLVEFKDFPTAVTKFDSALNINPSYVSAIHNRGLAFEEMKEYKKARADFKMALAINPQYDKSANELDRMDRLGLK